MSPAQPPATADRHLRAGWDWLVGAHPFGDRSETPPRRPGNLARSEIAVSTALGVSPDALRRQTWSHLKAVAETLDLVEMFPRDFQVQLIAA
jgi:hypothetical protein